jgi:hypothetical protein
MKNTKANNDWANKEIERWKMKTLGVNPVRHYIAQVVSEVYNQIPSDIVKYSGVDYHIIEDIITHEPDEFMKKNIYDFYEEQIGEIEAAEFFGRVLEEYMLG